MKTSTNETSQRLYLRLAVKLMLWVSVASVLWVLLQATGERREAREDAASVAFDVSDMKPGEVKIVNWASKPLLIVYRSSEWKSTQLSLADALFRDPHSEKSVQPDVAINVYRSANPDWFVAVGLGTAMGCPLQFRAPSTELYLEAPWPGGFVDSCDTTRYDLAGRVFRQQSAKKNIVVPDWQLADGNIVVRG